MKAKFPNWVKNFDKSNGDGRWGLVIFNMLNYHIRQTMSGCECLTLLVLGMRSLDHVSSGACQCESPYCSLVHVKRVLVWYCNCLWTHQWTCVVVFVNLFLCNLAVLRLRYRDLCRVLRVGANERLVALLGCGAVEAGRDSTSGACN